MKKLIISSLLVFITFTKQSQSPDYQQGIDNPEINHTHHCNLNSLYKLPYDPNETVLIVGVNDVSRDKLKRAEKIIKDFYKFHTEIAEVNLKIYESFYRDYERKIINCDKLVRNIEFDELKVVYITDEEMWGTNSYVRGYTTLGGRVLVSTSGEFMQETIIHEIGHTYGLGHCSDLTCVMAICNDVYDSGTFCKKCKKEINY